MGKLKVHLVPGKCVGAGQCVMSAVDVFDQNEDGIAMVVDDESPESLHQAVRKAARLCPAAAIIIEEC